MAVPLVLLALCALGSAWDHPVLVPLAAAVVVVGAVGVALPTRWRGTLLPELLLCGALGWFWVARGAALAEAGGVAQVGFLVLAVCAWLLVAAPAERRQTILAPVAVALLLPPAPAAGQGRLVLALAAVLALAVSGWRDGAGPGWRRGLAVAAARWRWSLLPLALVAAVLAGTAWAIPVVASARHAPDPIPGPDQAYPGGGVEMRVHPGHPSVSAVPSPDPGPAPEERTRDGTVVARWLDGGTAAGSGYLRALACDELRLEAGEWRWRWPDAARQVAVEEPTGPWTSLLVLASGSVVLRPDAALVVDQADVLGDDAGNRWWRVSPDRAGPSAAAGVYRVAPGPAPMAGEAMQARCRLVPSGAADLFAPAGDLTAWRTLDADRAAAAVTAWLQARCRYRVGTRTDPPGGEGLRRFLWATTPAERSGDCRHFTTAMVLALRMAGHAARAVTGFLSDERAGSAVVFRMRHAHAWVEVVGPDGVWRRIDPTPAAARQADLMAHPPSDPVAVRPAATPSGTTSEASGAAVGKDDPPTGFPWGWVVAGLAGAALLGLGRILRRWRSPARRERALARSEQELVRLAAACGVTVTPGMTITAVCTALTARTGVELSRPLAAHLAARYGDGPLPPPWPEMDLLAGVRRRK